ncbi:MAG: dTDP-4-dehydrorhamnose reductase [Flavobacteriales bacterium]|nr:dTDP-4-dehydrorhamnose reductase [Flavobacteriales bacterium]
MKNVLVTGANGQLGSSIKKLSSNYGNYNFIFTDVDNLDLTSEDAIRNCFQETQFYAVLNCAAYTAVDLAETEQELSNKINAESVRIIAEECKKQDALLIHISTDYVFDGDGTKPYVPTDRTNPQNVYGKTKLLGEQYAKENNPKTVIIRTAWVYSPYGKNFVKTMQYLFDNKDEISVVADQKGIPTLAEDLAEAMLTILESKEYKYGVYHYTNSEPTNWYEFALEIKKLTEEKLGAKLKINKINSIPTSQYPTPAKRPMYSVLDCSKINEDYNVTLYNWKESLRKMIFSQ